MPEETVDRSGVTDHLREMALDALERKVVRIEAAAGQTLAILEVESKKFNPDLLMIREATYILRSALK